MKKFICIFSVVVMLALTLAFSVGAYDTEAFSINIPEGYLQTQITDNTSRWEKSDTGSVISTSFVNNFKSYIYTGASEESQKAFVQQHMAELDKTIAETLSTTTELKIKHGEATYGEVEYNSNKGFKIEYDVEHIYADGTVNKFHNSTVFFSTKKYCLTFELLTSNKEEVRTLDNMMNELVINGDIYLGKTSGSGAAVAAVIGCVGAAVIIAAVIKKKKNTQNTDK